MEPAMAPATASRMAPAKVPPMELRTESQMELDLIQSLRRRATFFSQKSSKKETTDHNASRADVESSFSQFAQLVHAARRPLPTQSGDGAYLDHVEPSGLLADIKVCSIISFQSLLWFSYRGQETCFADTRPFWPSTLHPWRSFDIQKSRMLTPNFSIGNGVQRCRNLDERYEDQSNG